LQIPQKQGLKPAGRGEGAISRPFGKLYKMRGEEKRKDNYCKRGKRMWK